MHNNMNLLNCSGEVIGKYELIDQTENSIFCKSVIIEKSMSVDEVKGNVFKFHGSEFNWGVVNIPVMFSPGDDKTVIACYGKAGAIEFRKI